MSEVIMIHMEGITPSQYDSLRELVRWDTDVPEGMRIHIATFDDGVLRMTDIWDSAEQYGTFAQTRIGPALAELGITGQPQATIGQAHDVFPTNTGA